MKMRHRVTHIGQALLFGLGLAAILSIVWYFRTHIWVVIAALLALVGLGAFSERWSSSRRKKNLLAHREALSPQEIYAKYYASSGLPENCVTQLWEELAKTLGYEASRIRPSDQFGVDLKEFRWVDGEVSDLSAIALERSRTKHLRIDLSKLLTVDDYIRAFCGL